MMFGKVEFVEFKGLETMPQAAASAWSVVNDELVGASYKPLLYVGKQVARGVNHVFIAEQTLANMAGDRRLVTLAVNEFEGVYTFLPHSVTVFLA